MVYWSWGSLSAFLLSENQGEKKMIFFSPRSAKVTELANLCVCFFLGACYYDANQSMYVFGGCTQSSCNAAFNDLWRLDLNSKEWIRPLASGERWQMFNSPTALSKLTLSVGLAGLILYFPACFIIIWLVFRLYPFFFFFCCRLCVSLCLWHHTGLFLFGAAAQCWFMPCRMSDTYLQPQRACVDKSRPKAENFF